MRRIRKLFASVLSLLIFSCQMAACRAILQPACSDLTEANSFILKDPVVLDVSVGLLYEQTVMAYESSVVMQADLAAWQGEATVYWLQMAFRQDCTTICTADGSYKQWRGNWCESKSVSPATQLDSWLQLVGTGTGVYTENPCIPADVDEFISDKTSGAYAVTLQDVDVDWRALCDVNLDLLFGGDYLIQSFSPADVTLYFDCETWHLTAVFVESASQEHYIKAVMSLSEGSQAPDISLGDFGIVSGNLAEEWELITE